MTNSLTVYLEIKIILLEFLKRFLRLLRVGRRRIRDGVQTITDSNFRHHYVMVEGEQHGRRHIVVFERCVIEEERILLPNLVLRENFVQINTNYVFFFFIAKLLLGT